MPRVFFYILNRSSVRIWRLSNGERTIRSIILTIATAYSAKQESVAADIVTHITQMEKAGLL